MFKMVNGKKVECSKEEKVSFEKKWNENDKDAALKRVEKFSQDKLKNDALEKMKKLGFTDGEVSALFQ